MECGEDAIMKLESVEVVAGLGVDGGAFLRGTSCGFTFSQRLSLSKVTTNICLLTILRLWASHHEVSSRG